MPKSFLLARDYSSPAIRKLIKSIGPEKIQGVFLAPLPPDEIPVYKAAAQIAKKNSIDHIFSWPLAMIKTPDTNIKRILALETVSSPLEAIRIIADEARYRAALISNILVLYPAFNTKTSNILKGTLNNSTIYKALHNLELRHLPVLPNSHYLKNIPRDIEFTYEISKKMITIKGLKIPLTWLFKVAAAIENKKIRLENPLKGHISANLNNVSVCELLTITASLFKLICIYRKSSIDMLEASAERVNFYNKGSLGSHKSLSWLSMFRSRAENHKIFRHAFSGLLEQAYEELIKSNYERSLLISSHIYKKHQDLYEALFIMMLSHAGAGRFSKALSLLKILKQKCGDDDILNDLEKELNQYISLSIIKGEIKMLN
jgi:hypothetical protein